MSHLFNLMGFSVDGEEVYDENKHLNKLMDADARHVVGRLEITYTDPFLDESIVASADTTVPYTSPIETADNSLETAYKWFSLTNNKLDGTFHPLPSADSDVSVGWWSESLSSSTGHFFGRIRYIRDWLSGGSTANGNNYWSEISAFDTSGVNVALGKTVTSNGPIPDFEAPLSVVVDGNNDSYTGIYNAGPIWLRVDLGANYPLSSVSVAHTSYGDRKYHGTKTEVSSDGVEWHVLYDSAVSGEYTEPYVGKTYPVPAASEPTLSISFDPRAMYQLRVIGDDKLKEYPVDFTIQLLSKFGELLHEENVVGNNAITWNKILDTPVINVATIKLIVHRISASYRTNVKIVEFYTAVQESYETEDIVSINLLEEQMFEDQTLPIGNVSSNEIDVRLYNYEGHFNADNRKSPLYGLLKKNRRVKAWLGTPIKGEMTWFPLGTFWTTQWDAPRAGLYADFSARDRMELLRTSDFTVSQLYTNKSVKWLAQLILNDAGVKPEEYVLDSALDAIIIPYAWFERMSHRDALVRLATVALARTYCDRQGRIVMQIFKPAEKAIYAFSDDRSLFNTTFPISGAGVVNYVEVQATSRTLAAVSDVFTLTEPIAIPANSTVTETFMFDSVPVTAVQEPAIIHDGLITVDSYQAYAWGIEITFTNESAAPQDVESVVVKGRVLEVANTRVATASDAISIRDEGKSKYELLTNEFIQDVALAQRIADLILVTYKDPRHDAVLESRGHITLTLGDRISVPDYDNESYTDYTLVRQSLAWDGSLSAVVEAQKIGSD